CAAADTASASTKISPCPRESSRPYSGRHDSDSAHCPTPLRCTVGPGASERRTTSRHWRACAACERACAERAWAERAVALWRGPRDSRSSARTWELLHLLRFLVFVI